MYSVELTNNSHFPLWVALLIPRYQGREESVQRERVRFPGAHYGEGQMDDL